MPGEAARGGVRADVRGCLAVRWAGAPRAVGAVAAARVVEAAVRGRARATGMERAGAGAGAAEGGGDGLGEGGGGGGLGGGSGEMPSATATVLAEPADLVTVRTRDRVSVRG